MELTLKITDPTDLSRFATLLSLFFSTEESSAATNLVVIPAEPGCEKSVAAPVAEPFFPSVVEKAEAETNDVVLSTSVCPEEITKEKMRALVTAKIRADRTLSTKVKEILTGLGASTISNIPEARKMEFVEQVNAL